MRKMYKTPKTESVPVEPTGMICGSPETVTVDNNAVNNVEIF